MSRRRKKRINDYLRQDNRRGMGLARDVRAGQARETPYGYYHRMRRRGYRLAPTRRV